MKKLGGLFSISVAVVVVLACHRNRQPKYGEYREPPPSSPTEPAPAPVATASGTCDASCNHYLQCKGNYDPNAKSACLTKCAQMNLTQQQLLQYEATDCTTAIWQAENSGGTSGNGGTSTPKSSECNGCVWDGSSCIWLSQSNWGAGPYSGAYSSCKAYCCPGH